MEEVDRALQEAAHVRTVVLKTLTQRDRLRGDDARMSEQPLLREGRVCGIHFALYGPREVLLTAIWDADASTLWCYDSRGERFQTLPISAATAT